MLGSGFGDMTFGGGDPSGSTAQCATIQAPGTPATGSGTARRRGTSTVLHNPLGDGSTVYTIVARVIKAAVGIVGSIALLMFIYGGMRYMTAGGSEEGVKTAKATIINATIGLLLIFFSYTIISIFLGAFNQPVVVQEQTAAPAAPATETPAAEPTPAPTPTPAPPPPPLPR